MRWSTADISDQHGRTIVVTGANSGLGRATAAALAERGAHVILACRTVAKGQAAAATMTGSTEVRRLDLADLASVRDFAAALDSVDVLINNAGLMAVPHGRTRDGFELQFGTNHLGHFALTGLLLPAITDRVVVLSSLVHGMGRIDVADPNWEHRRYHRWAAYAQSKLANLMFAFELARRLAAADSPTRAVAAHPGYAATELHAHAGVVQRAAIGLSSTLFGQSAAAGALPTLYAATVDVPSGSYFGPGGVGELRGQPNYAPSSTTSRDERVAGELWRLSERLTGVRFLD